MNILFNFICIRQKDFSLSRIDNNLVNDKNN